MKKTDIIIDVTSGLTSGVTGDVTSDIEDDRISGSLPINAWSVLRQMNIKLDDGELKRWRIAELKKRLINTMHINTLRTILKRLEREGLIVCIDKRTGDNRRHYRYKATTDGIIMWEKYLEESRKNFERKNKG